MARPVIDIPAGALARFAAAEARLYPLVLTDPAGYRLATTLVAMIAAELLRSCADISMVLARRDELIDLLPQLAADAGLSAEGVPADAVIDAASALRCRELLVR